MQVSKWGNSLAIRLPKTMVEALALKVGDNVELRIAGTNAVEIERKPSRKELIEQLKQFEGLMPADFKFDRDEANAR